ncbi:MAG: hypothetical protein J0L75_09000 [Spirochaetes bacterium]|nr:hypothetical protein [Spirochaetota bacterium]
MLRDRITATQLADFWRCPRKARYTDRLPPDRRDPDFPLRHRILEEGNAHEARLIGAIPGVVILDSRRDGFDAVFAETKRLMARGVPAIHHGALLRPEGAFTWLAEPDLLENTGTFAAGGHPLYRVVEIKNSAEVHSAHAVQLALNAWILEEIQGGPADHQLVDHGGRRTPVPLGTLSSLMARLRGDCLRALESPTHPEYFHCAGCLACDWSRACAEDARAADALGRVPGLGEREINALIAQGIPTLTALSKADGALLFPDFPGLGDRFLRRAQALLSGVEGVLDPQPPMPPADAWLLHLERDVAITKGLCLFAGLRFRGGEFFFHSGPAAEQAVRDFFSASRPPVFWTTTRSSLSLLREGVLVRHALGQPRSLHGARSLEGLVFDCRALPFEASALRPLLLHYGLCASLLPDPLETFYENHPGRLERETRALLEAALPLPERLRRAAP